MRWEDERYVRLYTRDTITWKLLPWQSKAILPLLLRKLDRAGVLELGDEDLEGVAALIEVPWEVVEAGLRGLLKRGVFLHSGKALVMPNFLAAQEVSMSDAQRKREQRERERNRRVSGEKPIPSGVSQNVTECHEMSQAVTPSHEASQSVTPYLAVPCLTVPLKETHVEPPAPLRLAPAGPKQPGRVEAVFEHWRKAMKKPPGAKLNGKRRRAVEARLREGYTVEDLCRAVDGCALSPYHMGQNDQHKRYDDLELICRDGPRTEGFIERTALPPPRAPTPKGTTDPANYDWGDGGGFDELNKGGRNA